MGYYTNVEIYVRPVKSGADIEPASRVLSDFLIENYDGSIMDNEIEAGEFRLEDARWSFGEDEIVKISEKFPDVVFEIYGDGEDSEDIWQLYCYRGHIQCGLDMIYIPFNSNYCEKKVKRGVLAALYALKSDGYKDDDPIVKELEKRCEEGSMSVYDGT